MNTELFDCHYNLGYRNWAFRDFFLHQNPFYPSSNWSVTAIDKSPFDRPIADSYKKAKVGQSMTIMGWPWVP